MLARVCAYVNIHAPLFHYKCIIPHNLYGQYSNKCSDIRKNLDIVSHYVIKNKIMLSIKDNSFLVQPFDHRSIGSVSPNHFNFCVDDVSSKILEDDKV